MKLDKRNPLYSELMQFDHTGSLRTKTPFIKAKWRKLHERGLIQKALKYSGAFEISQKGRDTLKGGA